MYSDSKALTKCLVEQRGYTQLINKCTTDYGSLLDHIYTNIPDRRQSSGVLESYFSYHKPVFVFQLIIPSEIYNIDLLFINFENTVLTIQV